MRNFNKDNNNDKPNDNMMKRPLTLDLNKKIVNNNNGPPILSTPDVNLCKLGSPELENYILNTNTLETPTPSAIFPSSKVIFRTISKEPFLTFLFCLRSPLNKKITQKGLKMRLKLFITMTLSQSQQ